MQVWFSESEKHFRGKKERIVMTLKEGENLMKDIVQVRIL